MEFVIAILINTHYTSVTNIKVRPIITHELFISFINQLKYSDSIKLIIGYRLIGFMKRPYMHNYNFSVMFYYFNRRRPKEP